MMITFTPMTTIGENKGLYYYGARYYNPQTSIWFGVDPLASEYPSKTPYHYCSNNPIMKIDVDGNADIYSMGGKWIGTDGVNDGRIFLARGKLRRTIKGYSKMGLNYNLGLSQGENLHLLPSIIARSAMLQSEKSAIKAGVEYGGHFYIGGFQAVHWSPGTPPVQVKKNGQVETTKSVTTFMINGTNHKPLDMSQVETIWHVHVMQNNDPEGTDGSYLPSVQEGKKLRDTGVAKLWENQGFKGNLYVIGTRTNYIGYYDSQGLQLVIKSRVFYDVGANSPNGRLFKVYKNKRINSSHRNPRDL